MHFGIATCNISPPFPTSMGGYGKRDDMFDDVHDPLEFTAVVLEQGEHRALLGAADLITFANDGRTEWLLNRLAERINTTPDRIMLNASHTHGGPKMPGTGLFAQGTGDMALAQRYADWLADRVMETAELAANRLQPGSMHHHRGRTRLPMNRRLLVNGRIVNAPNPDGAVDDTMHLVTLRDAGGHLAAVMMRLSCHPVATGSQHRITADFVGGWKAVFREALGPQVTPVFLQGSAGDMRPRHAADGEKWRKVPLADMRGIGREILNETLQALLNGPATPLGELILRGHAQAVTLPCQPLYIDEASVRSMLDSDHYLRRAFARHVTEMLGRGEQVPTSMSVNVQTLWLDDHLALVGTNCEPLMGLGGAIERAFAPRQALVLGYTNGCVCYAPDSVELARGGYEADSYLMEPWSGPWVHGFEKAMIPACRLIPENRCRSNSNGNLTINDPMPPMEIPVDWRVTAARLVTRRIERF
jgi:hypothetical protein